MSAEVPTTSALVDFVSGTAAGIASLLAGHPFDTIKTRLQAQPSSGSPCPRPARASPTHSESRPLLPSQHASTVRASHNAAVLHPYRSATHAFRVIVKKEKFLGLFKGVTWPMLGVAVMNASIFGFYGLALRFQNAGKEATLTQIMVAGMVSGLGSSLITAPIDLIKIRQQMNTDARPSTFKVLVSVVKNEGLFRGLFRGWGTTAIRDVGYGPYFFSYELMNRWVSDGGKRPLTNLDMAMSGGLAGVLAWLSTFWADVVKTKIQASTHLDDVRNPNAPFWKRSLFLRTAAQTYKDGGVKAFFAGVGPTVLRALPVNAVMFIVFESVKDSLIKRGY